MELLVVIAVIGLLSSIALVNLSSAREKARINRALYFEAQVDHTLRNDIGGEWSFDTGTQLITDDSSDAGNTLSYCPTCGSASCDATCWLDASSGQCLQGKCFNAGGTRYVYAADHPQLSVLGNENVTVSLWVRPTSNQAGGQDIVVKNLEYKLTIAWPGTGGKITLWYSRPGGYAPITGNRPFPFDDRWHHILAVWDNKNQTYGIFLDGVVDKIQKVTNYVEYTGATRYPLCFGRGAACGTSGWQEPRYYGLYDRIRVYNEAIDLSRY